MTTETQEAGASPASVISIENLSVQFPGNDEPTLESVSIEVLRNEFVALVGGSGVGKSTLLRIIAGLLPTSSGTLSMRGEAAPGTRRRSLVFQDGRLLPWLTVKDNIRFGLKGLSLSTHQQQQRINEVLTLTRLEEFGDRWPHQLSGGQVQRVGIARALAVQPSILLMDEPFSAVDALTRRSLQDELLRIWEHSDAAIVFVTHDIEEALYLADRVLVLGDKPARVVNESVVTTARPRDRWSTELREEALRLVNEL